MLTRLRMGWAGGTTLSALLLALACSGSSVRNRDESGGSAGEEGTGATGSGLTGSGATGAVASDATGSGATGSGATGAIASGATGSGAMGAMSATGGTSGAPPDEICGDGGCIGGSNGTAITPPGPVLCGGVECEAPLACCLATQRCFDPTLDAEACAPPAPDDDPWGRPTCSSNADCDAGYFCQIESGLCQGTGHCHPIDNCGGCSDSGTGFCKVCGCDGNTYANFQTACLARTNVVSVSGGGCGETVMSGGGGSSAGVRTHKLCAVDSNCGADETCCTITGFCYPTSDPDQCRIPPEGTRLPCTSDAQCADYEYCFGEGCSGPGGCKSLGSQEDCGVTLEPVCGCDGVSYTSAACAATRGVRVASEGECAEE
jgi:hypothetical protein